MENPNYHGEVTNLFPNRSECLAVDVLPNHLAGGRDFLIRLAHEGDDPMNATFADLCPANARSLAAHLVNAADVAEAAESEPRAGLMGARRLSTVTLCGKAFYLDERLRQLRSVEDPGHFFDLDGAWC